MADATCLHCGGAFSYTPPVRGRHPALCSAQCRRARRTAMLREQRGVPAVRDCVICGAQFDRVAGQKYCSVACRNKRNASAARGRYRAGKTSRIYVRSCEECGTLHTFRRPLGRFCSAACRQRRADRDPDRNRKKNRKRRLVGRGESYRIADIAERDGYRCHLCGRKVDMSLSGNDRLGPTIDHLIPISKGGDDVESNVALAHRSCNCARGNRGIVQLRLAA